MCSRFVGIGPAVIDHRGVAVLAARVAVADRYSRGSFPRVPQPRRGDLDRLYVIAIGELPGANGRGARCDDRLEQTPAVQLQHPARHQLGIAARRVVDTDEPVRHLKATFR